jgi:hypothetical protein
VRSEFTRGSEYISVAESCESCNKHSESTKYGSYNNRRTINDSVPKSLSVNLLKPSGNFTYDQV